MQYWHHCLLAGVVLLVAGFIFWKTIYDRGWTAQICTSYAAGRIGCGDTVNKADVVTATVDLENTGPQTFPTSRIDIRVTDQNDLDNPSLNGTMGSTFTTVSLADRRTTVSLADILVRAGMGMDVGTYRIEFDAGNSLLAITTFQVQ